MTDHQLERAQFLLPTTWVSLDSVFARIDPQEIGRDMSAAEIQMAVLNWSCQHQKGVLLIAQTALEKGLDWTHHPEIEKLGTRMRLQLNSFKELADFALTYPEYRSRGFGLVLFISRTPGLRDLKLASEHCARIIYCQNPLHPLDRVTISRLDQLAPGWKIWFPPATCPGESLFSAREMSDWLRLFPSRAGRLIVLEGLDGPLCPEAQPYFHDLHTDPLALNSLSFLQSTLVKCLANEGWRARLAYFVLAILHLPLSGIVDDLRRVPQRLYWITYGLVYGIRKAFVRLRWSLYWITYGLVHGIRDAFVRLYWITYGLVYGIRDAFVRLYWITYGLVYGIRDAFVRLYWITYGLVYGIRNAFVRLRWSLYPVFMESLGMLRRLGGVIMKLGVRTFWAVRRTHASAHRLCIKAYWLIRRLGTHVRWKIQPMPLIIYSWGVRLGIRVYWAFYGLSVGIVGCVRAIGVRMYWMCYRASLVLFYPVRKAYWFLEYQLQTRIRGPGGGASRER